MTRKYLLKNQKGVLLIGLIITMAIITIAGTATYFLTAGSTLSELFKNNNPEAYYLAESGARFAAPLVLSDLNNGTAITNIPRLHNKTFSLSPGVFTLTIAGGPGNGYASSPTVAITGGGGSGAAATATVSGGYVTKILVTNQGSGYTSAPTVTIDSPGSGGPEATATATATVSGGKVTNISLSSRLTSFGTLNPGGWFQTKRNVVYIITAGFGPPIPGSGPTNDPNSSFNNPTEFAAHWTVSQGTNATAGVSNQQSGNVLSLLIQGGTSIIGMKWPSSDSSSNPNSPAPINSPPFPDYAIQIKTNISAQGGKGLYYLTGLSFRMDAVENPQNSYGISFFRNEGTSCPSSGDVVWPASLCPALSGIPAGKGATATATIAGPVSTITVTNGGSGYTSAPTVTISAPGGSGTQATATATINGSVSAITVPPGGGGSGYTTAPTVTISAPGGSGTQATATAALSVLNITVTNGGTGYNDKKPPTVTIGAPPPGGIQATATATVNKDKPGDVTGITVTNGGSGYTSAPTVTIESPSGKNTPATASVSSMAVSATITVTNGGSGYTTAPTVTISAPGGSGTQATATATINGSVSAITVPPGGGGSGYTTAPTVTISAPGGSGTQATATATINGSVTAINVSAQGSNYSYAPPVTISAPGGSGTQATATATVSGGQVTAITVTDPGSGYTAIPTVTVRPIVEYLVFWKEVVGTYSLIDYSLLTPSDGVLNTDGTLKAWSTIAVKLNKTGSSNSISAYIARPDQYPYGTVDWTFTNFYPVNWHSNGTNAISDSSLTTIGSGATATATVSGGHVTAIIVTNGGSGYTAAPTVVITDAAGSGATATATVSGGNVTAITVTNDGRDYTAPTVTIAPPEIGLHAFYDSPSSQDVFFADFSVVPMGGTGGGGGTGGVFTQFY